jgi:pseudouridine-5'-phosphate glycosidase
MVSVTSTATVRISKRVTDALSAHLPVVALESTVVTHGLPRPRNLEAAKAVEAVVVSAGAVPATIGIIGGQLIVGLDADELTYLSRADAEKASLWNLASIIARKADGGTTVAATLHAAAMAGIAVFATGGIGGVHDAPFDESADLAALASYSLITVCAGPKNILDVPATLERLESLGVAVVGFRSDTLAGFTVPLTDLAVPSRVDTAAEAAAVLRAQRSLGLTQGVLLSNPVSSGLAQADFAAAMAAAQHEAHERGVTGARSTPFLLSALARLSGGDTLEVNTRLLEENAALAARVAAALAAPVAAAPSHPEAPALAEPVS